MGGPASRRDPPRSRIAGMRYVITGGSGYIGSRLVDLLERRDDTEKIVICDVAPPKGYRPQTEYERLDVRDREAVRSVLERVAARRARAPGVHPQPLARRGVRLRRRRERHAQRARGGRQGRHATGARDDVGGRLRRLPGQPGAADRGRPGARRGRLHLRARQDRVRSPLPALGGHAPRARDDDRAALHRVRPERRQLPGAAVDQAAVRRRRRARSTARSSSCTRTTWSRGSPGCCSAATRAPSTSRATA